MFGGLIRENKSRLAGRIPVDQDACEQTTMARASTLHLPHGQVELPIFMPVATQASLKGLTPEQLEETSCRLCLNNTLVGEFMPGLEGGQ